jgi:hypothetical protein
MSPHGFEVTHVKSFGAVFKSLRAGLELTQSLN